MSTFWMGERERRELAYVDRGYGFIKAGMACSDRRLVTQSLIAPAAPCRASQTRS